MGSWALIWVLGVHLVPAAKEHWTGLSKLKSKWNVSIWSHWWSTEVNKALKSIWFPVIMKTGRASSMLVINLFLSSQKGTCLSHLGHTHLPCPSYSTWLSASGSAASSFWWWDMLSLRFARCPRYLYLTKTRLSQRPKSPTLKWAELCSHKF